TAPIARTRPGDDDEPRSAMHDPSAVGEGLAEVETIERRSSNDHSLGPAVRERLRPLGESVRKGGVGNAVDATAGQIREPVDVPVSSENRAHVLVSLEPGQYGIIDGR